jgi:hypothetical protein
MASIAGSVSWANTDTASTPSQDDTCEQDSTDASSTALLKFPYDRTWLEAALQPECAILQPAMLHNVSAR